MEKNVTDVEVETPTTEADINSTDAPDAELPDAGSAMTADVVTPVSEGLVHTKMQALSFIHSLSQDVVYLMGLSFILGSLFTIFVLLVLDFMRRNNTDAK